MAATVTSDIRAEVIAADPNWPRDSRYHVEYEFRAGERKFKADYTLRGAYHDEP